jgi:4-hydroxybenzoate polyprenyltransferase
MPVPSKFNALLQLIRFDKPIGTLLLLWPTLWALWIAAEGLPDGKLLLVFVAGTFVMRSAGCVINDLADRNIDGAVDRTRQRPLVTGAVTVGEAVALFLVLLSIAFVLVLQTNQLTVLLSLAGAALAACYPFMKRFTHLPQVVLGVAFSWGIPMAFAAQLGELPSALWAIFCGNLLWIIAYDTQYAMADRDDDLLIGIKSSAILFGRYDRFIIACLQILALLCLYLAGVAFDLGPPYQVALVAVACLFAYHQYLIRNRDRDACFKAFLHNRWVGLVIFIGIVLHYAR